MLQYIIARPFIYIFILIFIPSVLCKYVEFNSELLWFTFIGSGALYILSFYLTHPSVKSLLLIASLFLICWYRIFEFEKKESSRYAALPEQLKGSFNLTVLDNTSYPNRTVFVAEIIDPLKDVKIQITDWNKFLPERALYGDTIQLHLKLLKIHKPFSRFIKPYEHYLLQQQVLYQATLVDCYYHLRGIHTLSLTHTAQTVSKYLKNRIDHYSITPESSNLLNGILLGDLSAMDKSLKEAFRMGGISHILAVSGMHLGLFYLMVVGVFKQLRKWRWLISYKYELISVLIIIWMYALITGLSVAVCRSAIMFSLFQFARLHKRKAQAINILFAGASLMVFIQPQILYDIGFQLSCLALAGIFWISKYIQRLYFPSTASGKYIWSVLSITLSVQLIITPVCLYHFFTFPLYFLLTNLVWAPATPILMVSGIAIWIMDPLWPEAASLIMSLTDRLTHLGLKALYGLNSLPYANIEYLWFEKEDCLLYFLLFIMFSLYQCTKRLKYLYVLVCVQIIGILAYIIRETKFQQEEVLLAYTKQNKFEFILINRGTCAYTLTPGQSFKTYAARKHVNRFIQTTEDFLCNSIMSPKSYNGYLNLKNKDSTSLIFTKDIFNLNEFKE